jgi:deoxyadenosine/deoxycytidine kinase
MHIAIAGNIGAGKTSLTRLLAKHFKWDPHFEDVVDNPYLDDFYHQMERWSFNLQIYFLNSRFRQVLQIRESGKKIIQDKFKDLLFSSKGVLVPNRLLLEWYGNKLKKIPFPLRLFLARNLSKVEIFDHDRPSLHSKQTTKSY